LYNPATADQNSLVVGMHNKGQPDSFAQRVRVTQVIPNPKWGRQEDFFMTSDIMLIKLERPLTFNDAISPVCLPKKFKPISSGSRCYSTGWGTLHC